MAYTNVCLILTYGKYKRVSPLTYGKYIFSIYICLNGAYRNVENYLKQNVIKNLNAFIQAAQRINSVD